MYIYFYLYLDHFSLKKINSEAKKWVKSKLRRIHNFRNPCAQSYRVFMFQLEQYTNGIQGSSQIPLFLIFIPMGQIIQQYCFLPI